MLYKLLSIFLYIIVLTKKSFSDMNDRISKIRKIHSVVSILLFVVLICFCDYTCKELKLSQISLSKFGIDENIGYIWNSSLFILSILLYIDAIKNVNKFYKLVISIHGLVAEDTSIIHTKFIFKTEDINVAALAKSFGFNTPPRVK